MATETKKAVTSKKKPVVTYVTINGKKYIRQYRDDDGNIRQAPAGKYVDSFGRMRALPKARKPATKKPDSAVKKPSK